MSTSDINEAFESGKLELDDIISMDSTPISPAYMDGEQKISMCRQTANTENFLMIENKIFLNCCTRSMRNYPLETGYIDEC